MVLIISVSTWIRSFISIVLLLIQLSRVVSDFKPKSNCDVEYCGVIPISYPFGIATNCFHDKSFEIDCKKTGKIMLIDGTPSFKPYSKSIDLEVIQFYEKTHTILIPANQTSYNNAISDYDLRGTPFSFSSIENIFVGVGCNVAYTADDDDISVWCDIGDCDKSYGHWYNNRCTSFLRQNIQTLRPMVQSTIDQKVILSNR